MALAFPGVGQGEAEQGPGAVPVVVDGALFPDAGAAVDQDAGGLRGQAEEHLAALALTLEQAPVDHAGEGGTYGLFTYAHAAQDVDDAARVDAQVPLLQDVVAEEGEHERLRARLRSLRGVQDVVVHGGKGTTDRRRYGGRSWKVVGGHVPSAGCARSYGRR